MGEKGGNKIAKSLEGVKCTSVLRDILKDLIGESAVVVLEYHLVRKLAEAEPFELLLTDPKKFYDALVSIIGSNAAHALLKLLLRQVTYKYKLTWFQVDKFVDAVTTEGKDAREQISKLFKEIYRIKNT